MGYAVATSSVPCGCWQCGRCRQGSPGSGGELWDPPARHRAGPDPLRRHPPWAGAGLGGTGSPVGSDFSPGSSARLPPHSCPLTLLLLAGGACPYSGPIPGTWPSSPKAAPTPPPCTALLTPSASPGPRGVMSGKTSPHTPGGASRTCKGRGADGAPPWLGQGSAGGVLVCLPHAVVGHPPHPVAALPFPLAVYLPAPGRKGRWLHRSRPGAAEFQCPPCQSRQVPSGRSHACPVSLCPLLLPALEQPWSCPQTRR